MSSTDFPVSEFKVNGNVIEAPAFLEKATRDQIAYVLLKIPYDKKPGDGGLVKMEVKREVDDEYVSHTVLESLTVSQWDETQGKLGTFRTLYVPVPKDFRLVYTAKRGCVEVVRFQYC